MLRVRRARSPAVDEADGRASRDLHARRVSPTRFWNEYQWGDLKADPAKLLARYFDAHLYFANRGTHRLMLRLPKARVDLKALRPYFAGEHVARLTSAGEHLLLDLTSDVEDDEYVESPGSLAGLSPLRAELMRGDLRPAYLAWLLAAQEDEVDDDEVEPPVPAGLAKLTAAQEAMIEFLRVDPDLVAAAARGSAALEARRGTAMTNTPEPAGHILIYRSETSARSARCASRMRRSGSASASSPSSW